MQNEGPRSFARMLEEVSDGELQGDAATATHKLLQALYEMARETNTVASGKLTLTLEFTVDAKRNVEIAGAVAVKAPSAPKRTANYWLTPGSNVSFEPPERERRGPVREVAGNSNAPREVVGQKGS